MRLTACILVLSLCLPVAGKLTAGEVLTLDDCIEIALQKRASIIAARGAENLAKWDKTAALGAFLPRISASYDYSKSKSMNGDYETFVPTAFDEFTWDALHNGDSVVPVMMTQPTAYELRTIDLDDQDRTGKSLRFSANMPLVDFTTWFDLAAAGADKDRAHLNVIASEQDMILSVKVAYYLYLAVSEKIAVDQQAVERSQEQLKLNESKYELGSASKSDVLKQKVLVGNDRLALLASENAVTTRRADLAYTVGLDPNADIDFSTDFVARTYDGTLAEAMAYGLTHQPDLLAASKSVDAAGHSLKSRWAGYLPTLNGFASYSFSDGTSGDTVTFNSSSQSRTYGFSVSWNIFDGFWRERQVSAGKVMVNNARASMADQKNLTSSTIKSAYLDIDRLNEQKTVAQENVDAASEDLKITQEKYNLGAATILEMLDAQVSVKGAQVSLIQADFDLNTAVARLENAMGKM